MTPAATLLCCVESGPLEVMTVRLVESLRRWGGRLARCPVFAVTPRCGPALSRRTREEFDRLDVTWLRPRIRNPYAWHPFMNKAVAMDYIQDHATTPLVVWMDSDMLVLGEPDQLLLPDDATVPGADFAACALEKGGIGSSGPGDPNEPYWAALCAAVGLKPDDLPWVLAKEENVRIRLYFNSGVFAYRRSSDLPRHFLDAHHRYFGARIAHPTAGVHFLQPLLGLAVARGRLRWRELPHSHHFTVHGWSSFDYQPDAVRPVKVLHYHNAMQPHCWPDLLACLRQSHPEVHDWLSPLGPCLDPAGPLAKVMRQALRISRSVHRRAFLRRCTVAR